MTEYINAMFLLVNNYRMIGMLLSVVHGQVQKANKHLTNNKRFPNHSILINYVGTKPFNTHQNVTFNSIRITQSKKLIYRFSQG